MVVELVTFVPLYDEAVTVLRSCCLRTFFSAISWLGGNISGEASALLLMALYILNMFFTRVLNASFSVP
jgi:hypothetical protein